MSPHAIDLEQAREELPELVQRATDGQEVILTQEGEPVAKIVPITAAARPRRTFGSARGLIHIADDFDAPLDDFKDYM